jgi:hypothetical protein
MRGDDVQSANRNNVEEPVGSATEFQLKKQRRSPCLHFSYLDLPWQTFILLSKRCAWQGRDPKQLLL